MRRKKTRTRKRKGGRESRSGSRVGHTSIEVGIFSIFSNSLIDSILDIDEQFARLEAQVADLTEGSKETVRMNACLAGLETEVHWFTGALEGFLGRIRIDDGLRLVSDNRCIGSVDPAHFTLNIDRDDADSNAINIDSTVSEPDPLGSDPMVISDEDEAPTDIPSFVAGTASTPSDTVGDIRMDMLGRQARPPSESGNPPFAPPAHAPGARPSPQAAGSESLSLPLPSLIPPPTVNLIPATPQTSQEKADQSVVPQADPTPTRPAAPEPTQEPSRQPSWTPVATLGPLTTDDSFAVPQQDSPVIGSYALAGKGGGFFLSNTRW
jgi:hypothetical protein